MSRSRSARRRMPHCCQLGFEQLEDRTLLAINWANQGSAGNDSDGLNALFGGNAQLARDIVNRAIFDWSRVILNFNYSAGPNIYNLNFTTAPITSIADSNVTGQIGGKPTEATIRLQNIAATHYLDPTPLDDAEFTTLTNPYTGYAPGVTATDLYATVLHEIGHAMGFDQDPNLLASTFTTDTGIDDPNTATAGNLLALNVGGGPIEATFTAADTGHLWEGPGTAATNAAGLPSHPELLMNSGRAISANERNLISDFEANLLAQIYGYTISPPSGHNNMMVNFSLSTSILTVVPQPGNFGDNVIFNQPIPGWVGVTINGFSEMWAASAIASIIVNTGQNNDTVQIDYNGGRPTTVNGDNLTDSLTLNNVQFATVFTSSISAAGFNTITHNGIESLTINGTSGNDGITVTAALIPTQINTGLGDDTVDIAPTAGGLHTFTNNVDWDGGGGADSIDFELGTTSFAVRYNLDPTGVIAREISGAGAGNAAVVVFTGNTSGNKVNVKAGSGDDEFIFAPQALGGEFHGGNGDDTFTLGGGNLGTAITSYNIFGEGGTDTLELDDSSYTDGTGWFIESDVVIRFTGGGIPQFFSYTDFEGVSILAGLGGTGGNSIEVEGSIFVNLSITGGAGSDAVVLTDVSNFRDFFEGENDPPFHFDIDLDGGDGFDTLTVDDTTSIDRIYSIRPDNVMGLEGAPLGLDVDYVGFQDMNFLGGAFIDEYYVFGTPPDIFLGGAGQIEILGNGSQDSLILFPRNAQAQLTINCDVTFQGGGGTDTVLVDASGSPFGLHYQMAGGTLTGMGAGSVFVSGNEQLTFNAGGGNDIWTTVSGPLSNPPTIINAGSGDNTFNIDASLTPIALTINGGPNLDALNLIDSNNPSPSTSWAFSSTSITRTRSDGGTLPKVYTHSALDRITVNGGGSVDLFFVDAVATGQTLTLNAGANLDGMLLGSQATNNLDSIQGAVVFNGQAGGGNIAVLDANDPTGDVVHLTQNSLGALPGDTLFAPGGSLTFSDLVDFGAFPGITLNLGSGTDTVFAQPLAVARVTVNGGNPTSAPGDNFRLSLAGVTSPVFTPNGAGAGTYTFGNAAAINYTGFETASAYIPGDYSGNGLVGPEDYNVWRGSYGMVVAPGTLGDGNGDGKVDTADYVVWRKNLGSMSPASGAALAVAAFNSESSSDHPAAIGVDTEPVKAPNLVISSSPSPIASFALFGLSERGNPINPHPRRPPGANLLALNEEAINRIADLAYEEFDARRSTKKDVSAVSAARHEVRAEHYGFGGMEGVDSLSLDAIDAALTCPAIV